MCKVLNTILSKLNRHQRPLFYRDRRVLLSFLVSLPILCFGYIFPAVVVHLAAGVFWDWWFFSYKKVRESDVTPSVWLEAVGMTAEDLDYHSKIFMWLRHGAFILPSVLSIAAYMFKTKTGYQEAFFSAYFFFRLLSAFYPTSKGMMYPWVGATHKIQEGGSFIQDKSMSSSYSSIFNHQSHTSFSEDFGVKPLCMTDPMNLTGLTNTSSPNYIGRDYNSSMSNSMSSDSSMHTNIFNNN